MEYSPPRLLVVGSLVMDLITTTGRIPNPGETVIGMEFSTAPGGKGANQALQAARLGAQVAMVGKVGDDGFGEALTGSLAQAGVDVRHILRAEGVSSAVGNVQLLVEGGRTRNNRIIVAPGANHRLTPGDVAFLEEGVAQFDMVLLQLEIPTPVNEQVARWADAKGVPVMLNPAPSAPLPPSLLKHLAYLSPNEHEAADLTGMPLCGPDGRVEPARLDAALRSLHGGGAANVIITLGAQGSVLSTPEGRLAMPCVSGIRAVDPTAAGDSFLGAFCTAVAAGLAHPDALALATYTAALTVSAMGAQPSLPRLPQVLALMEARGCGRDMIDRIQAKLGGNRHE